MSIFRPIGAPTFAERERRRLDLVASHFVPAIQLRRIFEGREKIVQSAKAAFEHALECIALLGRGGEILVGSGRFEEIAKNSTYLSILDGYLVLRDLTQHARFLDYLGALTPQSNGRLSWLLDSNSEERLFGSVRSLLKTRISTEWPKANVKAVAILSLKRVVEAEAPDAALIAESLGISPAQARLVAALVVGKSLRGYAFEVGISVHTARTHLKNVFVGIGVRSQAALIRVVLTRLREKSSGA